jgi:CBS domain containing-hemolysin-like protein
MGLSGFFSSSETSFFSLNTIHLEQMRRDENPRLELIKYLLSQPRRLIVTILIGNEFVNVSASVISAVIVIQLLGTENKYFNLLVMVPILLLVGEITPKTLALRHNVGFAAFQSKPIQLFAKLITPVRWIVRLIADGFTTLIVGKERTRGNIVTEDMLRTLAREAVKEGVVDHQEARFVDQLFEFSRMTLSDVMVPRSAIFYLPLNIPYRDMMEELVRTRHSRVPIYAGTRDNVVGILYARDVLDIEKPEAWSKKGGLKKIMRPPLLVPECKPARELFEIFIKRKLTIAMTVDEYGGVTGLVTMKNLLEQIFGEFRTLSDAARLQGIEDLSDGRYAIDGELSIVEFNREMHAELSHEHVHTVAGLVLNAYGEVPPKDAVVEIGNFRFTVNEVVQSHITGLTVERTKQGQCENPSFSETQKEDEVTPTENTSLGEAVPSPSGSVNK